jgi:hypothetical protein
MVPPAQKEGLMPLAIRPLARSLKNVSAQTPLGWLFSTDPAVLVFMPAAAADATAVWTTASPTAVAVPVFWWIRYPTEVKE